MERPVVIGVTGGIGAGKSTAVEAFARHGAEQFSADRAVHELYVEDEVRAAVVERWGERVLAADGSVDRGRIASIVFTDESERRWLEGLLHPRVARAWLRFLEEQRARLEPPEFVVAEVPLLFEAGLEDRYDAIVVLTAPLATRIARAEARGSGRTLTSERASSQMSDDEKSRRAHFTYANTGSHEQLEQFVASVLEQLRARD